MANLTQTTCPRCAGSGHFAFHMIHGTVCFKCNGAGVVMVDLKAQARRKARAGKVSAATEARREVMIRLYHEVINELNAGHNFDLTTMLGLDMLNRKTWEATGRTIVQIRDERVAA